MKMCRWRGLNVHVPKTRDAVTITDVAVEASSVALFRNGHNVTCRCMAEEGCKPEDCDALYVTDENGQHLATLYGASFRARQLENGAMAIYRAASVKTGDVIFAKTQDHTLTRVTPVDVNRRNAEFWELKEEEACQK